LNDEETFNYSLALKVANISFLDVITFKIEPFLIERAEENKENPKCTKDNDNQELTIKKLRFV